MGGERVEGSWLVLLVATAACGDLVACHRTCPAGATLHGSPPPAGFAQWCERGGRRLENLPVPGRTFNATLGIPEPTASSGLLDGPMTEWHANGRVKSHGKFVVQNGKSVPHGIWSFWYPSGKRLSVGRYHYGDPVACFAGWDADGEMTTYLPTGDRLRKAKCRAEIDPEASQLAESYASGSTPASSADPNVSPVFVLGLGSMLSRSTLGIHADGLAPVAAELRASYWVSLRRNFGRLSLALGHGYWWTNNDATSNLVVALLPGFKAFRSGPFTLELSAELGTRVYGVRPLELYGTGEYGQDADRAHLWTLYGGLHLGFGFTVTRYLSVHASAFWRHDLPREIRRSHSFGFGTTSRTYEVDWELDSQVVGALLELRIGDR